MCECRLVFLVVGVRLMVTDVRCDMWPRCVTLRRCEGVVTCVYMYTASERSISERSISERSISEGSISERSISERSISEIDI